MLPRELELQDRARYLALELAKSGRFRNWREIRDELKRKGRRGVDGALTGRLLRSTLNLRCARAARQSTLFGQSGFSRL